VTQIMDTHLWGAPGPRLCHLSHTVRPRNQPMMRHVHTSLSQSQERYCKLEERYCTSSSQLDSTGVNQTSNCVFTGPTISDVYVDDDKWSNSSFTTETQTMQSKYHQMQ